MSKKYRLIKKFISGTENAEKKVHREVCIEIAKNRQDCEEQFHEIEKYFKELKSIVDIYKKNTVRSVNGYMFSELALLMRDMENDKNKFAYRLEEILKDMDIEEIKPKNGDSFDYKFFERNDCTETGNIVKECVLRGWKFGSEKLLGAVVTTYQK